MVFDFCICFYADRQPRPSKRNGTTSNKLHFNTQIYLHPYDFLCLSFVSIVWRFRYFRILGFVLHQCLFNL